MRAQSIPIFAVALCLAAQQLKMEDRAVRLARQTAVSTLEPGLPKQPLAQWLARAAGTGAKIDWEANDCGEQTGNPESDRERDFPLCVDAVLALPGGRTAIVSVAMGSFRKGVAGAPKLWFVGIGAWGRFKPLLKLSELAERIKAAK